MGASTVRLTRRACGPSVANTRRGPRPARRGALSGDRHGHLDLDGPILGSEAPRWPTAWRPASLRPWPSSCAGSVDHGGLRVEIGGRGHVPGDGQHAFDRFEGSEPTSRTARASSAHTAAAWTPLHVDRVAEGPDAGDLTVDPRPCPDVRDIPPWTRPRLPAGRGVGGGRAVGGPRAASRARTRPSGGPFRPGVEAAGVLSTGTGHGGTSGCGRLGRAGPGSGRQDAGHVTAGRPPGPWAGAAAGTYWRADIDCGAMPPDPRPCPRPHPPVVPWSRGSSRGSSPTTSTDRRRGGPRAPLVTRAPNVVAGGVRRRRLRPARLLRVGPRDAGHRPTGAVGAASTPTSTPWPCARRRGRAC